MVIFHGPTPSNSDLRINGYPNVMLGNPSSLHPSSRNVYPFARRLLGLVRGCRVCVGRGGRRGCIAGLRQNGSENSTEYQTPHKIRDNIVAAAMIVMIRGARCGTIIMPTPLTGPGITEYGIYKKKGRGYQCNYRFAFHCFILLFSILHVGATDMPAGSSAKVHGIIS